MQINKYSLVIVLLLSSIFLMANNCEQQKSTAQEQEETRDAIMDRANQMAPTPTINNFLTRESVVKWMERNDDPSKVFYVYVIADTGQIIGYYTASSRPVNYNTFLTPPDRWEHPYRTGRSGSSASYKLRQAPGADGVYYGQTAGDHWYFFDAESDALVEVVGMNLYISDQPLELDADPIQIQT